MILGGTLEARLLAARLAARPDTAVTLSLAGRTRRPVRQPVPVISGGFGGAAGLEKHLRRTGTRLMIDATHPYAARMSANAAAAAAASGIGFFQLVRPAWQPVAGDRWQTAADGAAAAAALGAAPRRVFLTLGRQELAPFLAAPQHRYLIRSVDPVEPPLAVPEARYLLGRGPFDEAAERALLEGEGIEAIVAKNSGGTASYGKIAAARALAIPVILIDRPALPDAARAASLEEAEAMAAHALASPPAAALSAPAAAKRGV